MFIEILGAESLGVRGLSTYIKTAKRKILIDPGIALGFRRHGLLPHPLQVAFDEKIRAEILSRLKGATDVVISHFHGDHIPLRDANPYQLRMDSVRVKEKTVFWCKNREFVSPEMVRRYDDLAENFKLSDTTDSACGCMNFSEPVPHGEKNNDRNTVMMTKIEEDGFVFVHASDIQLLNRESVDRILDWSPDLVLAGGPPLYLSGFSREKIKSAWENALKLSSNVKSLILDHHLLRDYQGLDWLERLSGKTGNSVICSADFMKKPRNLLEAGREELYKDMPISESWHKEYAEGKADTERYIRRGEELYGLRV